MTNSTSKTSLNNFLLMLLVTFVFALMQPLIPIDLWLNKYPWDGFMANRNAFMVLMVFAGVFIVMLPSLSILR